MIRTVLRLNPADGNAEAVIRYFREARVLERSAEVEGFISSELHVPLEGGPLLVTATWESPEAYQRWIDHPFRPETTAALAPLLDQDLQASTKGEMFSLEHGVYAPPSQP